MHKIALSCSQVPTYHWLGNTGLWHNAFSMGLGCLQLSLTCTLVFGLQPNAPKFICYILGKRQQITWQHKFSEAKKIQDKFVLTFGVQIKQDFLSLQIFKAILQAA